MNQRGITLNFWERWRWQPFWAAFRKRCRAAIAIRIASRKRNLLLEERLGLGDKCFLAVVRCGDERFLIAGAPTSVGLLAKLDEGHSFSEHLANAREAVEN